MNRLALYLTVKCFETQDPYLDLGRCDLTDEDFAAGSDLDLALRKCTHLEQLVLSNSWWEWDEGAKLWKEQSSLNPSGKNYFTTHPPALEALVNLTNLVCCGGETMRWAINDMAFAQEFHKITRLDLSFNQIRELKGLDCLTALQEFNISGNWVGELKGLDCLTALQEFNISENEITELKGLDSLTALQEFNISKNQITELKGLDAFKALQEFNISKNQITELKGLDALTALQEFNISKNQITELKGLDALTALQEFNISKNQITELKGLDAFKALQEFNISENQITELQGLDALTALQEFNIYNNQVTELKGLDALTALQTFDIYSNQITELKGLDALTALQTFNIANNRITELKGLDALTALQIFNISDNQITELKGLDALTALQAFDISDNQITELKGLEALADLQEFDICYNQVTELKGLDVLTRLQTFDISHNGISDITPLLKPYLLRKESPLQIVAKESYQTLPGEINVNYNPLKTPPIEIVRQGNEAVLHYFEELGKQGTDYLYEAKMLIVGQPRAGKTSLRVKLFDINAQLPGEEKTTKGIDIERLSFTITDAEEKARTFYYNVWDFGGQQIYQATHQFFLTNRSLYILVMDTGKDSLGNDDSTVNYWLQAVELLGKGSPLLLLRNEKNLRQVNLDIAQKKARFNFLKENDYSIDLNALIAGTETYDTNQVKQFRNLKEDIETELRRLPLVGFPMPKNWVEIRNELQALSQAKPYISREYYIELCEKYDVSEFDKQMELSCIFHDLGIFLHFQDYGILEDLIILQNTWATDAVFAVLDNEKVKVSKGRFTEEDIPGIWANKIYKKEVHKKLLGLMMQFELCYKIDEEKSPVYIVPEMLDDTTPVDYTWEQDNNLVIMYRYDFMPRGLLTRLIVRLHRHIEVFNGRQSVWKTGVKINGSSLSCPGTVAEIKEEWDNKNVPVRVKGSFAKELMSKLSFEIDELNNDYFKQNNKEDQTQRSKWYKLIPCNCASCKDSSDKNFYDYNELLERKEFGRNTIECNKKPFHIVQISELLDGVFSDQKVNPQSSVMKKQIRIFVSYSSKDRDIRELLVGGLNEHLATRESFNYDLWSDEKINLGANWKEDIDESLNQSDAAILLVSASFGASSFIQTNELAEFLKRKKENGYLLMPVLIRDYNFSANKILSAFNFFKTYFKEYGFNDPLKRDTLMPFDELTETRELNRYYRKLADFIDTAVKNHFNKQMNT
jgi:GTPase SAR1 family protein